MSVRHALWVARALALGGGISCGAPQTPPVLSTTPASASASASTSAPDLASSSVASEGTGKAAQRLDDVTSGSGPCRCSWETSSTSAPRVCRKGETSWNGSLCKPGDRRYRDYPAVGPLAPPDLAA